MTFGKRVSILVAFAVVGFGAAAGERAEHHVVLENLSGVDVAFEFPAPARFVGGSAGALWSRFEVPGTRTPQRPGAAALPEYSVILAVPRGTVPVAQLRGTIESALPPAPPPAVFDWQVVGSEPGVRALRDDDPDDPAWSSRVAVERLGVARHVELARLVVRPVRYDRRSGSWTAIRSAAVRVDFVGADPGEAGAPTPPDSIDLQIGASIANPSVLSASTSVGATSSIPAPEPSVMTPVKIVTVEEGIHEIRRADLDAIGVIVTGIDPGTFVLTHRGQEVAIEVVDGGDGSFDAPADFLRFYAVVVGGEETMENVYRLSGGVRAGIRMSGRDGAPNPIHAPATRFANSSRRETNIRYWGSLPDTVSSPWYGDELAITTLGTSVHTDSAVTLANVSTDTTLTGELRVHVQSRRETPGASPNHHVRIYLNGHLTDERTWTGLEGVTMTGAVPQGWVLEGVNTVRVENVADLGLTAQTEWVDWIELSYHDCYVAEGDYLEFTVDRPGPKRTAVSGFSTPGIGLYDISSPQAPIRLTGVAITQNGGTWQAEFSDSLDSSPGTISFAGATAGSAKRPSRLERDLDPTALRDAASVGADLLIVVHESLLSAVLPLAAHRTAQGLRTVVAKVGDVHDEFNGGIRDIQGLRNFVQWAFENYAPPAPTYVLLVGDATIDPADYRGEGDNLVSTQFFRATGFGLAPTDTWIAAVNGADLIPDLAVGRATARTSLDVERFVANVMAYENNPPIAALNGGILYVADDDDPNFESIEEDLIARFHPPAMDPRRVYLNDYPQTTAGVDAATLDIRNALDAGSLAAVYTGHGGRTLWANENVWNLADVASLLPTGHLTFVVALNCVNGYFANLDLEPYSLGEEWSRLADRGAVAGLAPSASGTLLNFDLLSDQVFRHLFELKEPRLGFATWRAVVDAHVADGVPIQYARQMVYFGDPAALLALDSDRDGHLDRDEAAAGTDADDSDSDDDGVTDGAETGWDVDDDGDGRVNAADPDSDNDGLPDGLESGFVTPSPDTDVTAGHFIADADPSSTTDHRALDSDGGGAPDGAEDRNANGRVDAGESDPESASDDPVCATSPPGEIEGLTVARIGTDVNVAWTSKAGEDPCVLYRIYVATDPGTPDAFAKFWYTATTGSETFRHPNAANDGSNAYYLVTAWSPLTGEGPLGHFGR